MLARAGRCPSTFQGQHIVQCYRMSLGGIQWGLKCLGNKRLLLNVAVQTD